MAGEPPAAPWPVPKFHFNVTFGDKGEIAFQEVSGLDAEHDNPEYRAGNGISFSSINMPGLSKGSNVTLRKGLFRDDSGLYDYLNELKRNTIDGQTITIQLLDEARTPLFTWTLANAFPIKVSGTDLNARNSEMAVEEVVLAHEGISFANA